MQHDQQIITLFGAGGFVGHYIVREAARKGYRLRVIVRDIQAASDLKTQGDVGQINLIYGDITKPETYKHALTDAYAVINLVGILFEKGSQTFERLHVQAASDLAEHAASAGVQKYLHMSALGVDKADKSTYARTKLRGEQAVQQHFPTATIFRPSVIFGAEDNFYNQFARMSRFAPMLPLIGGGTTLFQPVYVADVAEAYIKALDNADAEGKTYELGGPEVMSFKQILRSINDMTNRDRALVTVPSCAAKLGAFFAECLPTPPLTRDQVRLLAYDNIVSGQQPGFKELGIEPAPASLIVPEYLERYANEEPPA